MSAHLEKIKKDSRAGLPFLDDPTMANATPKRTKVGGVTFVRSKNGNLHRLGAVVSKKYGLTNGDTMRRAQLNELTFKTRQPTVKKKSELCKRFTSMGTGLFPLRSLYHIQDGKNLMRRANNLG